MRDAVEVSELNQALFEMNSAIAVAIREWTAHAVAMSMTAAIMGEAFNGFTTNSLERPVDNDGDGRY